MSWSIDITPINDTKEHKQGDACWCSPMLNEYGCWVHNSKDERELTEGKPRS